MVFIISVASMSSVNPALNPLFAAVRNMSYVLVILMMSVDFMTTIELHWGDTSAEGKARNIFELRILAQNALKLSPTC